jgi:predicted aspartyl protease
MMDALHRTFTGSLLGVLLAAVLLILRPGPALGETATDEELRRLLPAVPPVLPGLEEVLVTAPEPRYVAPTTRDRIGRIWAPVSINGRGPYRFVLDTGASRPAITQRVANELGLPVLADAFRLRGVTGSSIVSAVKIDTIEFGELMIEDETVPIVADAFGGAQGVLGGNGLDEKRIVIEFRRDQISIARSRRQPPPPGYSIVPFKYSPARGMRVDVQVGSIKTVAIIDTGGQVTIGNLALREALVRRRGQHDEFEDVIIGITEDMQKTARVRIPSIVAGEMIVRNAEISFGEMHIFDHWRLNKMPALLLGMDVLGTLDTLIIDYRRGELQINVRR